MNAVYFPAPVVVLLRRIFNVLTSLSISNQYLLPRKAEIEREDHDEGAEAEQQPEHPLISEKKGQSIHTGAVLQALVSIEWPYLFGKENWLWLQSMSRDTFRLDSSIKASSSSLPWFNTDWAYGTASPTAKARLLHTVTKPSEIASSEHESSRSQRNTTDPSSSPTPPQEKPKVAELDIIHRLLIHPALYDPIRRPRYPIVLCHGLYGFDVRGPSSFPSLQMHYWSNVLGILRRKVGAEVIVTGVPPTGSIISRSEQMHRFLLQKARGRAVNLLAHSMGGLDCRHLITHIQPREYTPISLTTISTPHRGSPFMDWCNANIGIGNPRPSHVLSPISAFTPYIDPSDPDHLDHLDEVSHSNDSKEKGKEESEAKASQSNDTMSQFTLSALPSSFTTLLLSLIDSPAYSNLTTTYLKNVFNPSTPDDPRVKYFSIAGRTSSMSVWHPLWLPKMVLDGTEEKERAEYIQQGTDQQRDWGNDGLVSVESAKWGEFLGTMEGCDHWEIRGARGMGMDIATSFGKDGYSDGWNWKDWARFVGAWNREEKRREEEAQARGQVRKEDRGEAEKQKQKERDRLDSIVKSSTDKLSAVVDWIAEQTPSINIKSPVTALSAVVALGKEAKADALRGRKEGAHKGNVEKAKTEQKSDLATKLDLERFYVALSRKLYEEGL